jgi:hypothetical protein
MKYIGQLKGMQKLWNKLKTAWKVVTADAYVYMEPAFVDGSIATVELSSYGLEPMEIWDANLITTSTLLTIIAEEQIEQLNTMLAASDVTMELCDGGFCPN